MRVVGVMRIDAMSIMVAAGKRGVQAVVFRPDLLLMGRAHLCSWRLHGGVFRRDSRKRLDRKAQCQQQDDEESAANRHSGAV